jgi:hypothetical protein
LSFLFFSSFGRFRAGICATGRKKADKRRSVVCYPGAKKVKPKNQKPGIFFPRPLLLLLLLSLRPSSAFYLVGVCRSGILCVTSRHSFLRDSVGGRNLAVSSSRYKVFIIGTQSMEEGEGKEWRRD